MDCAQTSKETALKQCSVVLDSAEVVNFYCGITGGYRYHYVSSTPKPVQKTLTRPSALCTLEVVEDPEVFLQSLLLQEPQIGCVFEKTKLIKYSSPSAASNKIVKTPKKCAPFSKWSKRAREKHLKTSVDEETATEQNQCDVEQKVGCAPISEDGVEKCTVQTTDPPVNSLPEPNSDADTCVSEQSRDDVEVQNTDKTLVEVQNTDETLVEVQNTDETLVEVQNTDETLVEVQNTDETLVEVQNTDGTPVEVQNIDETPEEVQNIDETLEEVQNTDETHVEMQNTDGTPEEVQNTDGTHEEVQNIEVFPVESAGETPAVEVQSKEGTPAASVEVQNAENEKSTDAAVPTTEASSVPNEETEKSTDTAVPTTKASSVPNEAPKKKAKKQKNAGVCPDCRKVFRKWSEFIDHMSKEHDALKCTECGKDCKDLPELTEHQRNSHETRQHQCYLCDRIFYHAITLKIHFFNLHLLNLESGAADSSDSATFTPSENSSQILAPPIAVAPTLSPKIDVPVPITEVTPTPTDEISYTVMIEEDVPTVDTTPSEIINLEEIEDTEDSQSQVKQSPSDISKKSPNKKGVKKSRFRNLHTPDGPEENGVELVPQVEVQNKKAEVNLKSAVAAVRSKEPKLVKSTPEGRYVAMGNLLYFKFRTKLFQSCCYTCGFNIRNFKDCVPHLRMAHALYVCRLCGDEFSSPDGLKRHEVKQHKLENFTCLACNLKFSNPEEKFKHYISSHEEKKRCKPCSFYLQGDHNWRVHQALYHTPDLEWAECSPPFFNQSPPRTNDGIAMKRHIQKSGEEIQLSPAKRRIIWHSDISEVNCLPNNIRSKVFQARNSVSDKLGMLSPLNNSSLVDKLSKNNTQIILNSKCDARKSVPHNPVVVSRVTTNSLLLAQVSSPQQLLLPSKPPQVIPPVKSPQVQSKKHIPVLKIVKRNTGTPQPANSNTKYTIVSSAQGSKFIVGKTERLSCLAGLTDVSVSHKQVKLPQSAKSPQSTKQDCAEIEVLGECRTKGKHNSVNKPTAASILQQNLYPKVVLTPLIAHPTAVKQPPRRPSILKNSSSKKQPKTTKLKSPRKSDVASSKALQETVSSMQVNSSTVETQAPEQMDVQSTDSQTTVDPQLPKSVINKCEMSPPSVTPDVAVDDCNNKIGEKTPQQMDRSPTAVKSNECERVLNHVEQYGNAVEMEPSSEVANTMEICEDSAEMKLNGGDEASALNPTGESPSTSASINMIWESPSINPMEVATEIDVTMEIASCSTPTAMEQIDSTIKTLLPEATDSNATNVSYSPMEETKTCHTDTMSHCKGGSSTQDIGITIQVSSATDKRESEVTDFESEAGSLLESKKWVSNSQDNVASIDDELCHVMDFSEPTEKLQSKPKSDMPVRQTEYLEQFLKFQNQNPR